MPFKIVNTYKNPSFITKPVASIQIRTMTPDVLGLYDQIIQNVEVSPALVPNTITDLKMNYKSDSSSSEVYNKADKYEISFTPFNYFMNNGNTVKIYFPKGSLIVIDPSNLPKCKLSVTGATSDCNVTPYNTDDSLDGVHYITL